MAKKKPTAKELAAVADKYDEVKQKRLALDRESRSLKEEEDLLRDLLIHEMRAQEITAIGGQRVQVTLEMRNTPIADSWGDIYRYIVENDAFELMYRRLNPKAIRERMEDGEEIPGMHVQEMPALSESRAKLTK